MIPTTMETTEKPVEKKPKKKQVQPKKHVGKTKQAVAARRQKIAKAITEGKTQKQAGIEAGLSPKTASSQVSQILVEPKMCATFAQLLSRVIPDDYQATKYRESLEATKVISANIIAKNGEGMADAHSMTKDFIEVPDFPTQLKANDSISKLKGHLAERTLLGFDDTATELMISALPPEYQDAVRKRLVDMAKK
jgi:hypothetical protein